VRKINSKLIVLEIGREPRGRRARPISVFKSRFGPANGENEPIRIRNANEIRNAIGRPNSPNSHSHSHCGFHFGSSSELAGLIRALIFCKFFGGLLVPLVASELESEGT